MSYAYTLGGAAVFSAIVTMPRHGLWVADVEVNTDDAAQLKGKLQLCVGSLTLTGTVGVRGGVTRGYAKVRLTAGNAGLPTVAQARGYNAAPFSVVLKDILSDAGETQASGCDATVLAQSFDKWTSMARPCGLMLDALVQRAPTGTTWRARNDGTIWVGPETWPDSGLVLGRDYQLIHEDPHLRRQTLGVEAPSLLPGTLLSGRKVSSVTHVATARSIRTLAWLES